MNFLVFTVFAAIFPIVFAKPAASSLTEEEFANMTFTLTRLNTILTAYKQYKEYIPSYIYDPVEALTDDQKTTIVQFINDYHSGAFLPANYQELAAIVQANYTDMYSTMNTIYTTYQEHVAQLGEGGQAYAADIESKLYADANPDRIIWACNLFNNAKTIVSQAEALLADPTESGPLQEAFPEAVKFLNSKEFSAYVIIVNNLKPLDCAKDRQQIFNTIKLFDTQSLLTSKD